MPEASWRLTPRSHSPAGVRSFLWRVAFVTSPSGPMSSGERKPRCLGSAKHLAAVKEIREARQTARAAMNKMRAELKKEQKRLVSGILS